jgi:hypothetical protein
MSKLIRIVFGMMVITAFSYNSYAQHRVLVPAQPYTTQKPAQFNQPQNLRPRAVVKAGGGKRIQVVKENFIAQRLNLTSQEAKAFWPLYRKYNQELTAVKILKRENNSNATSDGAEQVDTDLKLETKLVDIKKQYRDEFYKILPPEKISILYKSEVEFNNEAFRILTERSVRAGD